METVTAATEIVKTLRDAGYIAYFAGGWVRDYLMGHPSSDVDIATSASPEKILDLFPNTVHVGIAFGVVIVSHHGKNCEVATFRKDIDYVGGRRPARIEPAAPEEDALRRDFTINGMFYDPIGQTVHDFVGGREDIRLRLIRTIGNPYDRFAEDRLRMIRAIRFACRFDFHVDQDTQEAISRYAETLFPAVSLERIWQEFNKMAERPNFDYALVEMHRLNLLPTIFPDLKGVHLTEIKERVARFSAFPKGSPTIAYLLQLFPGYGDEKIKHLSEYLRTSRRDQEFALHLKHWEETLKEELEGHEPDLQEWCHLFSDPRAELCFSIALTKFSDEEQDLLKEKIMERREKLKTHIQRIIDRSPVVTSRLLTGEGVKPGKRMGRLLREGEKLAILYDEERPQKVLSLLKQSAEWEP